MSRTNIDIDDELVSGVMARFHLPSKRAAVDFALRRVTVLPMDADEARTMRGTGFDFTNDELEQFSDVDGLI